MLSAHAFADAGPHGGVTEQTKHHRFEVVFRADGLIVYPSATDAKPLDASKLSGTATFYHPNSPDPWFERPLRAASPSAGEAPMSLEVRIGLSKVPATGAKVAFQIKGLSDPGEPNVSFRVPFRLASAPQPVAAPAAPAAITYARATRADQGAINAQRVCKVSVQPLGSMGGPIKVMRGNQSVFLCCQSCLRKITTDPDRYFGPPVATLTNKPAN